MARSAKLGAGIGFLLGMPVFEVFLLVGLAVGGGLNVLTIARYTSSSSNLIMLLLLMHATTAVIGAVVGIWIFRARHRRPRLRVLPGGMGGGRKAG